MEEPRSEEKEKVTPQNSFSDKPRASLIDPSSIEMRPKPPTTVDDANKQAPDNKRASVVSRASVKKPPRIKHKNLWLLWLMIFQLVVSACDLWLNSSFVYEATLRGINSTWIGISFGTYYVIVGLVDAKTGSILGYLEHKFRNTRFAGEQRVIMQGSLYSIFLAASCLLTFVKHPYVFAILHGLSGFGPMLTVMRTYTQDSMDDDWSFRKKATKAILLGRVTGSVAALGLGTFIYDNFGWTILCGCCIGMNSLVLFFILTAPTRKVLWRSPPRVSTWQFGKTLPHMSWFVFLVSAATGFFFGTINALQTLYIRGVFDVSATVAGLVLAAAALFSIVAMALYPTNAPPTYLAVVTTVVMIGTAFGFPFSNHIELTAALLALAYTCSAYLATAGQIMMDIVAHPEVSVRASGWSIAWYSAGTAAASFAAGILYEYIVYVPFFISAGFTTVSLFFLCIGIWRYYEKQKKIIETTMAAVKALRHWEKFAHVGPYKKNGNAPPADPSIISRHTAEEMPHSLNMNDRFGLGVIGGVKSLKRNKAFKKVVESTPMDVENDPNDEELNKIEKGES